MRRSELAVALLIVNNMALDSVISTAQVITDGLCRNVNIAVAATFAQSAKTGSISVVETSETT
jgi:hypothetical protein